MKFIIEESGVQPGWWTVTVVINHEMYSVERLPSFGEALTRCAAIRGELINKLTETK